MNDRHRKELLLVAEHQLHRLAYPVSHKALCEHFRAEGRGDDLYDLVRELPQSHYENAAAVMEDLREVR